MSFEHLFKDKIKGEINKSEFIMSSKERPHISKAKIDMYSKARYVGVGSFEYIRYVNELDERYLAATDISYDTVLCIHDVNTSKTILYRFFEFDELLGAKLLSQVRSLTPRPNLEIRIIGMQNNQDFSFLNEISDFIIGNRIKLVEVDLFGDSTRHIAIDTKLGMSMNILMENRIYRPGELANSMTIENFEARLGASTKTT